MECGCVHRRGLHGDAGGGADSDVKWKCVCEGVGCGMRAGAGAVLTKGSAASAAALAAGGACWGSSGGGACGGAH